MHFYHLLSVKDRIQWLLEWEFFMDTYIYITDWGYEVIVYILVKETPVLTSKSENFRRK